MESLESFLERFGRVATDIDRVAENVQKIRVLQKKALTSTHRDAKNEAETQPALNFKIAKADT